MWEESENELRSSDAWDFDDLLLFVVRLLRDHRYWLQWVRSRWPWLLVDEFQDVNRAQAELVWLLAGQAGNVAIVGDEDQVVHRFRGADPQHIAGFAARHPSHATIVLGRTSAPAERSSRRPRGASRTTSEGCRRSLSPCAAPAGRSRCAGSTRTGTRLTGSPARYRRRSASGIPGPEVLILARTGYATEPVQLSLARTGVSHRVLGSFGLYERTKVKDPLTYLTLLLNPADAQAFRRAIQSPRRGGRAGHGESR